MTLPISAALKAHLAQQYQTTCTIWKVLLTNGTVLGFTDHDQDIIYGGVSYNALVGYTRSDVAGANDLSVDNLEVQGVLNSPSITEADLHAGIWDFAQFEIYLINWADTTMGTLSLRQGRIGEVIVERNTFKAEILGLTQAYQRTIGELTSPSCRAELYDARCKVNPASFTVTGALTGVSPSGMTLYDSARTEPGPTGAVAITNVSNSNPGQVTLTSGASFSNLEPVMLSGIVGPSLLNTSTIIRNLSGNIFDLGVDTSNTSIYPPYVSGGTCIPLGGGSGYFDFGLITFTGGLNNGLAGEVASYVPGQWSLELPFPYTISIGDTYSMRAGCNKALATCIAKFNNVLNFRGEPYLPGIDKITQVGKQ